MKLRPKSGIRRIRCNTCRHAESSNVGLSASDAVAFRRKHKGHETTIAPMHETSDAWRTLATLRNAERAVVRAAVRLHRVVSGHIVRTSRYGIVGNMTAQHLVTVAVEKLLKARAADRKRQRS